MHQRTGQRTDKGWYVAKCGVVVTPHEVSAWGSDVTCTDCRSLSGADKPVDLTVRRSPLL